MTIAVDMGRKATKTKQTEPNKPHFVRDEMILMLSSLQIKQNIYTNPLICQTMIVNKVPNFPSIFITNILLIISASV